MSFASTLDMVGNKWTLLVVRDIFRGFKRYNDFLEAGENITTYILADRLEKEKIISKKPYQSNPVRYKYSLTKKGRELEPMFREMSAWVKKYRKEVIEGIL